MGASCKPSKDVSERSREQIQPITISTSRKNKKKALGESQVKSMNSTEFEAPHLDGIRPGTFIRSEEFPGLCQCLHDVTRVGLRLDLPQPLHHVAAIHLIILELIEAQQDLGFFRDHRQRHVRFIGVDWNAFDGSADHLLQMFDVFAQGAVFLCIEQDAEIQGPETCKTADLLYRHGCFTGNYHMTRYVLLGIII